jgi:shikimate dehydrogenase
VQAGVLGHPISHSLSPALHSAAYTAMGLTDWYYEAIDCDERGLADLLFGSNAQTLSGELVWAGFSCTMPLKRLALELADEAEPLAVAVGAANTLLPRPGGGWRAVTTDVAGITGALIESGVQAQTITVIGAGGTAQAAIAALATAGVPECAVLVRDLGRTAELRAAAARLEVELNFDELRLDAPGLDADLIISTLPANAADPLAERAWRPEQAIFDAIYDNWPTAIARSATDRGAKAVSGALMLLHQAWAQVWLMTGTQPPLEAMRAGLLAAAPNCGV